MSIVSMRSKYAPSVKIVISQLHTVLAFERRPSWSSSRKGVDEVTHVLLLNAVDINAVPVSEQEENNVACVDIRSTTAEEHAT